MLKLAATCPLVAITRATWPSCARQRLSAPTRTPIPVESMTPNPSEIYHKPVVPRVYRLDGELPQPGRGIYVEEADRPDERDVFRRIFVLKAQIHAPSITFFSLPG